MIKAKDLMIGDYINSSIGIAQVISIDKVGVTLINKDNGEFDIDFQDNDAWLQEILLTPEILEKNGFIRKHPESEKRAYWILRVAGGNVKVKRNWGYFYFEVTGTPLEMGMFLPHFEGHLAFVHELQHALRLCGIDKEIEL